MFSLDSFKQDEIQKLGKGKQELMDELKRCQAELEAKRAECTRMQQKFKVGFKVFPNYTNLSLHTFHRIDQ